MKKILYSFLIAFMAVLTSSGAFAATSFTVEVYDSTGDELSGALVELIKEGTTVLSATTDRWGECDIETEDELTGAYQLRASCEGYSTQAQDIALPADSRSFTFNLVSTSATLSLTVKEDGESQWYWQGARCVLSLDGVTVAETETLSYSMGMCELKVNNPVEDRDYLLTVSKEGYNTVTRDVRLKADETTDLTVTLYKEGTEPPADETTVSGNVYENGGSWNGIEGATVKLTDDDITIATATTDASGDFTITVDRLLEGSYTLTAEADGYNSASRSITIEGGVSKSNDIGLTKASSKATIYGEVKDAETSRSIVGATLSLYQDNVLIASATSEAWIGYSLTVPAVNSEPYTLVVTADGYKEWTNDALTLEAGNNALNILMEKNNEEAKSTTVKGKVTNTSGRAMSGAKVSLFRADERLDYEFTDSEGNYEITIDKALDGTFTLTVDKDGYKTTSLEITIADGVAPVTDITISKLTAVLKATVKNKENGNPVVGATIVLEYAWEEAARGTTDAAGECEITIEGAASDAYQLSITATDYKPFSQDIFLSDGDNVGEFLLEPKANGIASVGADGISVVPSHSGVVLYSEAPVFVEIFKVDGTRVASLTVDGEQMLSLAPGFYAVRAGSAVCKINVR